ncbi:MAG: TcfC E-set like domain-containing protein, partial [Deltaproteobacteria bacterium]|nr:TcfC E-set like domain-containing protein [Deltaproteobacteria bacterium]
MVQKKRFFWIITVVLSCVFHVSARADEGAATKLKPERFSLLLDDDTYGSVLVRHGGGMFEIVHPDEILEQLPSTKAPKIFRALFSGLIEGSRVDYGVGSIVYNPKFKYITINIHSSFLLEDNRISPNNLQTETAMPSLSSWRTATITKEESQRESTVDVYFNQQLKGQLILRLSKHWFQVVDPTYLLSLLPRLKRQSEFISFFSGKIFDEKSIEGFASISLDTSTNQLEIEIADAFQFTQTQATEESKHELQPQYPTSRASDAFPKASSSSLLDDKPSSESVNSEEGSASKESGLASIQIHKLEEFESEPTAVENEYEPESMLFDLYLADTQRGTILVNFTENWFEVPNPNDLVEQLSETKDKQAIVELVSGRIHKKRSIENIGSVHYDLDTFQIILNIDPSLLTGHSLVLDDTLPNPERKFSLQQSVHYAAAGELDTAMDMALTHKTIASLSKYWLNANGTYVQNDDYEFTEFSANGIVDDFETNIGLLRTDGQLLTSSNDFVGLSVQTSENIITNQSLLRGSKLEVFVPSHARVDFFRGGRLLSSQVLDYGLQEINTVAFPQGSYDVDIVITEDDGSVSRES